MSKYNLFITIIVLLSNNYFSQNIRNTKADSILIDYFNNITLNKKNKKYIVSDSTLFVNNLTKSKKIKVIKSINNIRLRKGDCKIELVNYKEDIVQNKGNIINARFEVLRYNNSVWIFEGYFDFLIRYKADMLLEISLEGGLSPILIYPATAPQPPLR